MVGLGRHQVYSACCSAKKVHKPVVKKEIKGAKSLLPYHIYTVQYIVANYLPVHVGHNLLGVAHFLNVSWHEGIVSPIRDLEIATG